MFNPRVVFHSAIASAVVFSVAACDKSPTDPIASDVGSPVFQAAPLQTIPSPTSYSPLTYSGDQLKLCKDATSPLGTYSFNITAFNTQAGDQMASTVTLSPGQCVIVFNRTGTSQPGDYAYVTVTEHVPQGANYYVDHIEYASNKGNNTYQNINTFQVEINSFHGATLNFVNREQHHDIAEAGNGQVIVCKEGPAGTTATFTTSVQTMLTGDVLNTPVNVNAGECASVYMRVHGVNATVTVTEAALPGTTLTGATVNGATAVVTNRSVTVTANVLTAGSVIVFHNEVDHNTILEPTPPQVANGQVYVCKARPAGTSATFTTSAQTFFTGDVLNSSVTVNAGSCALVYSRAHGVNATVTVTETPAQGMTLTQIRVDGTPTIFSNNQTSVTANVLTAGHVLIFTNVAGPAA